jgi:LysM repeat protein
MSDYAPHWPAPYTPSRGRASQGLPADAGPAVGLAGHVTAAGGTALASLLLRPAFLFFPFALTALWLWLSLAAACRRYAGAAVIVMQRGYALARDRDALLSVLAARLPEVAPAAVVLSAAAVVAALGGFARPQPPQGYWLAPGSSAVAAHDESFGSRVRTLSTRGLPPMVGPVAPPGVPQAVLAPAVAPERTSALDRASLVRPPLPVTIVPERPREGVIVHEVVPGDTVWDLGLRYGISYQTILWANKLSEDDFIQIGQKLLILPVSGVYHEVQDGDTLESIAARYKADPQAIADFNRVTNETLEPYQKLIIPGGVIPMPPRPVVRPPVPSAQPAARSGTASVARPVTPPAPQRPVTGSGRFVWPARGVITTYFSGWHPGIDIAAPMGTPILAADGGLVTFTGWDSTGYGNRIIVNHGNGWVSTYNHLAAIYVRPGQYVSKGQVIGTMGSTGRSTGPHLHLEFLLNGRFVNPLGIL